MLHYTRTGQGHPLIILHGLYGSGDNWLTIARGLSSFCEVFLVDQRNHGKSFHSDIHDYPAMVRDLEDFMDELGLPKASILGHSMGGRTAMLFAAQHPGRVTRLIVADISPRSYNNPLTDLEHKRFHESILDALSEIRLNEMTSLGDVDQELSKKLTDKRLRQFLLKNLDRSEDGSFFWKLNIPAIRSNLPAMNQGIEDQAETGISNSNFPTLFLRGEQSDYIRETDMTLIRTLYPQAQVITIKNAGHWLHAEQPATFISIVKKFLIS
jgi:esterase